MSDLFDVDPTHRVPQDTEAFTLGASRIRSLKDALQALLTTIFATESPVAFQQDTVPSSLLAGFANSALLGSGLSKASGSSPIQVNFDALTLNVDASSPPKLQIKPLLQTSSQQAIVANGAPTKLTFAHGFAAAPPFIRAVYIPQVTGTGQGAASIDLGFSTASEIDVFSGIITADQTGIGNPFEGYQTSGGTVTFFGYRPTFWADATNVYLNIPDGHIFLMTASATAGGGVTAPTYGAEINKANWKVKIYARTLP